MFIHKLIFSLILLIFLVFLNFFNTKIEEFEQDDDLNNKGFINYRLGDFISGYLYKKDKKIFDFMITNYKDSICVKYYNKIKNLSDSKKWSNYKILNELVDEVELENLPQEKDIVIHLRLGDIINYKNNQFKFNEHISGSNSNNSFSNNQYGTNLSELKKFILKNRNEFNKFIFVYGIHYKPIQGLNPSIKYLEDLRNFLRQNKINFEERHNNNPDIDFAFMCKSKHFMPSGSGFSNYILKIIELRNNKVYKL